MSRKILLPDEIQRVYATKTYLVQNLHKKLPVTLLARQAVMTPLHFKESFQKLFDMSTGRYIHEARMQLGMFLLLHTEKSIKEIAALTGYRHSKNFMTAFKHFFVRTAGDIRSGA